MPAGALPPLTLITLSAASEASGVEVPQAAGRRPHARMPLAQISVNRSFRAPFVRSQWTVIENDPFIDSGSAYDSRDSCS
jgi:hypothetical protein